MKSNPAFSIITICRNEQGGMRRTCESITQQAHDNFEWIVVDGASTDGTLDILSEYRDRIAVFISEPDQGIYDAMNKGIANASGEYLLFMNGGDAFASNQVLQWVAGAPQKDLIYGDLWLDEANGQLVSYPDRMDQGRLLKRMAPHQAAFCHRSLFERFGPYDTSYRIAADYEFFVRLIEIGHVSHHHLAKPLAIFSTGGISSSKAQRNLRKHENHRVRMKYFPRYRWSPQAWRQGIRRLIANIAPSR